MVQVIGSKVWRCQVAALPRCSPIITLLRAKGWTWIVDRSFTVSIRILKCVQNFQFGIWN